MNGGDKCRNKFSDDQCVAFRDAIHCVLGPYSRRDGTTSPAQNQTDDQFPGPGQIVLLPQGSNWRKQATVVQ